MPGLTNQFLLGEINVADITLPDKFNYAEVFQRAKKNARLRGIPFDLTKAEFDALVKKSDGRCMVSGLPFTTPSRRKAGSRRPFAPSLDRIDSAVGYTKSNCRIVSIIVNCALNEWGEEPLFEMCRAVAEKQRQTELLRGYRINDESSYLRASEYLKAAGNSDVAPMHLARAAHRLSKTNNIPTKIKRVLTPDGKNSTDATFFMVGVLRESLQKILQNKSENN